MVEHEEFFSRELEETDYGDTDAYVGLRFEYYKKLAETPFDLVKYTLGELALKEGEALLDIGCAAAHMLIDLRRGVTIGQNSTQQKYQHIGRLCGIDASEGLINLARMHSKLRLDEADEEVEIRHGFAEDLPFDDDEFDKSTGFFVYYHTADPKQSILEASRVTKPGGKIVVATSGPRNKLVHRMFESEIADELGCEPPPIFAARFNSQHADYVLKELFGEENVIRHKQISRAVVEEGDEEGVEIVKWSLFAMMRSFGRTIYPEEWYEAIEKRVMPKIQQQFDENGRYVDYIERDVFICNNVK
jgi:ubiquinone/menaquinone biosynthesis C-methylase UbiE